MLMAGLEMTLKCQNFFDDTVDLESLSATLWIWNHYQRLLRMRLQHEPYHPLVNVGLDADIGETDGAPFRLDSSCAMLCNAKRPIASSPACREPVKSKRSCGVDAFDHGHGGGVACKRALLWSSRR